MKIRPRSAFVEDILGVPESVFRKGEDLVQKAWSPPSVLRNLKTEQTFHCGVLSTPSLGELRTSSSAFKGERSGKLMILRADHDPGRLDVGFLQSQPENKNAVFQVASNFNALELMNKFDERAMTEVGYYIHDRTQGPFASISAAPGLLLRHYYAFYQPDTRPMSWRQHYDGRQLELLGQTDLMVRNGYVEFNSAELDEALDAEAVRVCVHRDIQVTFGGLQGSSHEVVDDPGQRVDQVFTATADLACTNRELLQSHPSQVEQRIRALLLVAYEGTLRAAMAVGRKKVFLTLIGGGVFANPSAWIVDTLQNLLPLIEVSGLDVRVNTYRGIADPEAAERLAALAQQTGGEVVVY